MDSNYFAIIEAILFAMGCPVETEKISELLEIEPEKLADILERFSEYINNSERGIKLIRLNNSIQLVTRGEYHKYVAKLLETKQQRTLSQSALETLSIVAYNQPVTKAMIDSVRGVDSSNSVVRLMERDLVEHRGRLETTGRPVLYGTTEEFLRIFGLENLEDLPVLEMSVLNSITPDNNMTFDDIVPPSD